MIHFRFTPFVSFCKINHPAIFVALLQNTGVLGTEALQLHVFVIFHHIHHLALYLCRRLIPLVVLCSKLAYLGTCSEFVSVFVFISHHQADLRIGTRFNGLQVFHINPFLTFSAI